jgi:hypothetical protein
MPDDLGESKNAARSATSFVFKAFFRKIAFSAKRYESIYPGIPAEADVFNRLGATALKRTAENEENDLARKQTEVA